MKKLKKEKDLLKGALTDLESELKNLQFSRKETEKKLLKLSKEITSMEIINLIDLMMRRRQEIKSSPIPQLPLEMGIVEWCQDDSDDPTNTGGADEVEKSKIDNIEKEVEKKSVIEKAKEACKNTNNNIQDHFVEVAKTINMPKGATKEIQDYMLTRYACYLIAQNGDPRKDKIAFAQSYFALQTRKQELIEERIGLIERMSARQKLVASETELSKLIYERSLSSATDGNLSCKIADERIFGSLPEYRV